jgi:hypothetical protein
MTAIEPNADYDEQDEVLSLSGQGFLLLIQITPVELDSLAGVSVARWEDRKSIKAGQALGNPVFWCRSADDPGGVTALVGADDETWALAVEFPADVLLRALARSPSG